MSMTPYGLAAVISIVLMVIFALVLCLDAWPFSGESLTWLAMVLAFVMILGFIMDGVVTQA